MLIAEVRNNRSPSSHYRAAAEVESLAKQIGDQNDASTELNLSHILIPLTETRPPTT